MPLTDEQRLAVARELWAYWIQTGCVHLDDALFRYENEAKGRLEKGSDSK